MRQFSQNFTDPETGEEIQSTLLARVVGGLGSVALAGGFTVLLVVLFVRLFGRPFTVLFVVLFGMLFALLSGVWHVKVHNSVARWQHFRRQRLLQRKQTEEG
jgi:fatty acid desaturase